MPSAGLVDITQWLHSISVRKRSPRFVEKKGGITKRSFVLALIILFCGVLPGYAETVGAPARTGQTGCYGSAGNKVACPGAEGRAVTSSSTAYNPLDNWHTRYVSVSMYYQFAGVAYDNGTFAAVGGAGSWPVWTIFSSSGGTTWAEVFNAGPPVFGVTSSLRSVAYGNNTFAAVGSPVAGGSANVCLSPDGNTWTKQSSGTTHDLWGICYGYDTFVAVGAGGAVLTSPNGVTWTEQSSGTTDSLKAISYGNNTFVAVGQRVNSGTYTGVFATSPDGVEWSVGSVGSGTGLNGVAYGNNTFVAVGAGGVVLTSSNGVTWAEQSSGTKCGLNGIAYGGGTFAAVGSCDSTTPVLLGSPDGITWTDHSAGLSAPLKGIIYGNDTFVGVGSFGIAQSDSLGNPILTVERAGAGVGAVGSSPAGISCGPFGHACSAPFVKDTEVTLQAVPDTGSAFTGWSGGGCSGTGTCTVTMTGDITVTATFAAAIHTVGASAPEGHGTVSPETQKVSHGASASITMTPETNYYVAAITDNGQPVTGSANQRSTVKGRVAAAKMRASGKAAIPNPYVISNVTSDHTVVVTFQTDLNVLTVSKTGSGTGTFSATGLTCNGSTCTGAYSTGSVVNITAIPGTGSAFTSWSGCDSSSGAVCTVTMTANKSVTATFTLNAFTVNAVVSGSHGSVSPATQKVNYGASASITITPDSGYNIAGIIDNGQPVAVANPYLLSNVTADHNVTVTFSTIATLEVVKTGSGTGTVTSNPRGINCGDTCTYGFTDGKKVTLTAKPARDATFTGWSGGCSGTKTTCSLTMTEYTSVTANFEAKAYTVGAWVLSGHGSVSPATLEVRQGDSASIAMTPDAGCRITKITDNGRSVAIANPYVITNVTKEHTVVVTFAPIYTLAVSQAGSGTGVITSSPQGIDCGDTCAYDFREATKVTLTARAAKGSIFKGWSGDCSGVHTCRVTMNGAINATAMFKDEADIVVSPLNKNYGMVKPPAHKTASFTIKNEGKEALTVGTASLSDDISFHITRNTCFGKSLSANQTCHVSVMFAPVSTSPATATLSIPSNDPDAPVVTVGLAGNDGAAAREEGGGDEE